MGKKSTDLVKAMGTRGDGSGRTRSKASKLDEQTAYVEKQVERLREQLLDLSNRNRLLNFKHPQKSRKQVRVIDELPAVLYERLLSAKTFRFKAVDEPQGRDPADVPVADAATQQGLNPNFELGAKPTANVPEHHVDAFIQVLHYPTDMARRLEGMRQEHLTSLQELGVPSLYGVFGFLEWYESPNSERAMLSPLVLVPLEIERSRERGEYQYRANGASDEPEPNRTLSFRLKQDVGITLPTLDSLIETKDIDAYFAAVERVIEGMPRWRVRRYVTICAVSFARQVMYEDLSAERWSQWGGRANALLRALLAGDASQLGATSVPPKEPLLVTESDSTQVAAIQDALAGRSMVVKGPPGTGKSQTITNLIAAALAEGKTVLFVAEKMAALEVVKKRLDDAGLANFCLALHSTRSKKREVLDALGNSIKARSKPRPKGYQAEPRRNERLGARMELEAYREAISCAVGAQGLDARQLVWREQALRDEIGAVESDLLHLHVPDASSLTTEALQDAKRCLAELETAAVQLGSPASEAPWSFVTEWDPSRNSVDVLMSWTQHWASAIRNLLTPLHDLGWPAEQMSIADVRDLGAQLVDLTNVEATASAQLVGKLLADDSRSSELIQLATHLEERNVHVRRAQNVCRVEQTVPERSKLTGLMSHLAIAKIIGPDTTYEQVGAVLSHRRTALERLLAAVETLRDLAQSMGLLSTWDAHSQLAALHCACAASEAGRDLLRRRVPEALGEDSRPILEQAVRDAATLRASRAEIDGLLSGWDKVGALELRRHAIVLRTTGFFGRIFGSTFKASKVAYLSLSTGRQASREEMASLLQRAAEQLEAEEKAITGSTRLRQVCGAAFDGLSTDFEHLVRLAAWAENVRAAFPGTAMLAGWARSVLLFGALEPLATLAEFHVDAGEQLLREMSRGPVDLREIATTGLASLERIEASYAATKHLEIDGRTLVRDLEVVVAALESIAALDERIEASSARSWLGALWKGTRSEPQPMRAAVAASETIRDIAFPPFVANWVVSSEFASRVPQAVALGRSLLDRFRSERHAREQARSSGVAMAELSAWEATAAKLSERLESTIGAGTEPLGAQIRFILARQACAQNASVDGFCRVIEESGAWKNLPVKFEWVVLRSLAFELMRKFPKLIQEAWSGARLAKLRETARELEEGAVQYRRNVLVNELSSKPVPQGNRSGAKKDWTDAALLEHEIGKQNRNIPIRALMSRAHSGVLALTPCLMMSPLSIAQFLDEPSLQFDLLIVDEASQLRPEDALGALLRAKQLVVVGDEQQLPPTSFFKRSDEDVEDEDFDDIEAESLLDLAMNVFGAPRVLRWHYRSRHESLIAFSNAEFYQNELVVAPSPQSPGPTIGVSMDYVRGLYHASTNRPEAERTTQLVFELMRKYPERSIGVVAINQQQADLIRELVDSGVREEETKYIESWKGSLDPFFVKNLENVQGDERDIIVVSLTYGPDAEGRVYQRFGPIVGKYGHRRLNVLFSRAKHQLVLVTSMKPDDVRADADSNRGAQVLRSYLQYAALRATKSAVSERPPGFERLAQEISNLGFDVTSEVGAQSLELDLGVMHPDEREAFVAAIEVDAGDTKGLLKPTDRENTRPLVLGRLGWNIVQAWTSDWLREPAVARIRLRDGLAAACKSKKKPMPGPRAQIVKQVSTDLVSLGSASSLAAPPPALHVEVRVDDIPQGRFDIHGHRVRVGRGRYCEIRISNDHADVALQHLELRWERPHFKIFDIEPRVGIYENGVRLVAGPLSGAETHVLRLGLGRVTLRLAYGASLADAPSAEPRAHGALSSSLEPVYSQLDADERMFLTVLDENTQVSVADLSRLLARSPVRVSGMVRKMRHKLHDLGAPDFIEELRMPSGDIAYRRLAIRSTAV